MMRRSAFAVYIVMLCVLAACGNMVSGSVTASVGAIEIRDAWVPAMTGVAATSGVTGAAYMTIRNTGSSADRLLKATSDVAEAVEIHTTQNNNGVMQMRPMQSIEIPANGEVMFKGGGNHFMLIGLQRDLKAGDSVNLKLQFERAGTVDVQVPVRER